MAEATAILLAAGLSRRMGAANKLLLPFGDSTVVETTLSRLLASSVQEIVLVGSELSMEHLKPLESDRVRLVNNPNYEQGMTSSIQAGVAACGASAAGFMICLGDQPLIETGTYETILNQFSGSAQENSAVIVLPFFDGRKGNPVIFSAAYRKAILAHQEPEGCKGIVQANKAHAIRVDVADAGILTDIDTPADYDRASRPR